MPGIAIDSIESQHREAFPLSMRYSIMSKRAAILLRRISCKMATTSVPCRNSWGIKMSAPP